MKLEILELTDTSAKFVISGVDTSFVNTLRRTLIAEIPKMAIEDVEFHLGPIRDENGKDYESISPLFDEIIAHRLGMIPIPTDMELFGFRDKCKCGGEGCPNCTIMYSLNKKGPCIVYSGDLEPLGDEKFKVRDASIPIVKLGEEQALLIYATAILGTGKQHAKWSPTHGVGYKYYPSVSINPKKCDHIGGCIKVCPQKIFRKQGNKILVENTENCTLCKSCIEICTNNAITLKVDDTKFIFQFETDNSLTAKEVLTYALSFLKKKFEDLEDSIASLQLTED